MTNEQLQRANELTEIIKDTKEGLDKLLNFQKTIREKKEHRFYDDGLYSLTICKYKDGSGDNASFDRYGGNAELLNVIIETLSIQLERYEKEFNNI